MEYSLEYSFLVSVADPNITSASFDCNVMSPSSVFMFEDMLIKLPLSAEMLILESAFMLLAILVEVSVDFSEMLTF